MFIDATNYILKYNVYRAADWKKKISNMKKIKYIFVFLFLNRYFLKLKWKIILNFFY